MCIFTTDLSAPEVLLPDVYSIVLQILAIFPSVRMPSPLRRHILIRDIPHCQVVLRGLCDLCALEGLLPDLYANYDCSLASQNLYEKVVQLVCKLSFPVSGVLLPTHILAYQVFLPTHILAYQVYLPRGRLEFRVDLKE